jgi:hypothetical protein
MKEHETTPPSTNKLDLSRFISKDQVAKSIQDTYSRDLFPYSRDDLLELRLNQGNRILRRAPNLKEEIETALMTENDETILGAVNNIAAAYQQFSPKDEKPINTILSFLTLVRSIKDYKIALLGQDAPLMRARALMILCAQELAKSIPENLLTDGSNSTVFIEDRMDSLYKKTGDSNYSIYKTQLVVLAREIHVRDMATRYIEALPGDDQKPVTREELEHDSRQIHNLFSGMQSTRQFGVKMGYIPDERGGSLVFSPPHDPYNYLDDTADLAQVHPLTYQTRAEADIVHSRLKHPKKLQPKITTQTYVEETGRSSSVNVIGAEPLEPLSFICLGPDGELYVDRQCTVSYADMARTKGKYHAYRELQATVLAHYFDLTHAITKSPTAEQDSATSTLTASDTNRLEAIERLLIPRISANQPHGNTQQPAPEPDQPKRSVRYHGVTWFRRPLPAGWHASPDAHKLAEKVGVTLEPGETFVKAHHRGSKALGEVAGHQLITRNQRSDSSN